VSAPLPVYVEVGARRVFACALDWPGWCRSGRDEAGALAALAAAAPRYAPVAWEAGLPPPEGGRVKVVERLRGSTTTDFGAPGEVAAADRAPLSQAELDRLARLVEASWRVFDRVVAAAPAQLRRGPRGGGRDRDAIVAHVVGAEAAYARKLGLRIRAEPGNAEAMAALRGAIMEGLRRIPEAEVGWPPRYAARRIAWHVLDHAWEIEDRTVR
jgi:hypothetical protein